MIYELRDTITRNLIGAYDSEEAARSVVRGVIADHGKEIAATLALMCEDPSEQMTLLAAGLALVESAQTLPASA